MKKTLLTLFTLSTLAYSAPSRLSAETLTLPQYGFQIDPLDSPLKDTPVQAVIMFLPASKGFAPNVNVQIQPYTAGMKDYIALSRKQFEDNGLIKITESTVGDSEWRIEYAGNAQDTDLHWYARAILAQKKVYLVTATARSDNWKDVSAALIKCVDSFKAK